MGDLTLGEDEQGLEVDVFLDPGRAREDGLRFVVMTTACPATPVSELSLP